MITEKPSPIKRSKDSVHAVLTADIVNSTQLDEKMEGLLFGELQKILKPYPNQYYRGDSFQAYMKEPDKSLHIALLCRTAAISMTSGKENIPLSDLKISIGIGKITEPVRTLGKAKGEAFLLSGRSLDSIETTGKRLSVVTSNDIANIGLQVMCDYIDDIYRNMTPKQAGVIYGLLKGRTQQQLAEDQGKSKSTISQLVSSGGWEEIERLLRQYEQLIKQIL